MILGIFGEHVQETLEKGDDWRLRERAFLTLQVFFEYKKVVYKWEKIIEADRKIIREYVRMQIIEFIEKQLAK
jgi:hypothetical protein